MAASVTVVNWHNCLVMQQHHPNTLHAITECPVRTDKNIICFTKKLCFYRLKKINKKTLSATAINPVV